MAAGLAPTQRAGAAFPAAISVGLLKPLKVLTSLWSAFSASCPTSSTVLSRNDRLPLRWALSNVGPVVRRRTYYGEGDEGRPSRSVAEVYKENGKKIGGMSTMLHSWRHNPLKLKQAEACNWREAVEVIDQNRNPSRKFVGGIESGQRNTDNLKGELEREGHRKAISSRSIRVNDVLEIRDPEPQSREEKRQSPPISESEVTKNSVRQDLRTKEVPRKAFRVNGRSSPALVKAGLNSAAEGRLHSYASYDNKFWSRDSAEGIGRAYIHSAGTTTEAIADLQNRLQRGIPTSSSTYIKILQLCLQQKDRLATKQVHGCIIKSGMDKNPYVTSTLLNVYLKCGELLDARRVFDKLEKKTLIDWNSMIAGYAKKGKAVAAFELFKLMRHESVRPSQVTYLCILKACDRPSALKWGKEVHEYIRHGGFESDVRVGTALLQMYAQSGCLTEARRVFEKLTHRNVITWNVMIGGLAQHGYGNEAYQLFLQMRGAGFEADAFTYMSILNPSASAGALDGVKKVHEHALKAGLESDLRVASALVHTYAKNGSLQDARLVFDRMTQRDVITWNIMIGACAESGGGMEAFRLFLQMRREGFEPNAVTYMNILNASANTGALEWVKEVHGHAIKAGLESDLRVGNALVHMYAKSGSLDDARLVFDRMEKRDVVTWTVMIGGLAQLGYGHEAYRLFRQMIREGFEPNAVTYMNILNPSANTGALEWVKEVHGHAIKAGLESDVRVGNALVHMYAKTGSKDDAQQVFDRMEKRDVITWNIMIGACAEGGRGMDAYGLFLQMIREGFEPDAFTYASILNASASEGALVWVKKVHGHVVKAGLESDLRVGSSLVHMYAKCGSLDDARLVFDRIEKRDVVTWNIMIGAYGESGRGMEAFGLFLEMRRKGLEPNASTYVSILNASASTGALKWVKNVHGHALKAGLESDLRVGNALVHMYAKSGSLNDARLVFDRMENRDVVTWTAMIGGLAQHGHGHEALELFRKMNAHHVKPNETTLVAVLSACSHGGLVDDGRKTFSAMTQDYGIKRSVVHYTLMVDILGRAGHLEEAKQLISEMPMEPDVVTWTTLLGACRTYGNVELGELAANELFKLEPGMASTYVLLSNIYAAAGKWEKVSCVRTLMQERGVRKEPGRSWIEVDNKIHEFVVGDTSHPEAEAIYTELKKLSETLKAEGYIPDTRLVLHDINEEDKELSLCSHSEKLAIVYGLLHVPLGEPIRVNKNLRVCSDCHTATKYISKVTGREIIARDAIRFHHFKDGMCSCGDYW